jgi:hypothetical protein
MKRFGVESLRSCSPNFVPSSQSPLKIAVSWSAIARPLYRMIWRGGDDSGEIGEPHSKMNKKENRQPPVLVVGGLVDNDNMIGLPICDVNSKIKFFPFPWSVLYSRGG